MHGISCIFQAQVTTFARQISTLRECASRGAFCLIVNEVPY